MFKIHNYNMFRYILCLNIIDKPVAVVPKAIKPVCG